MPGKVGSFQTLQEMKRLIIEAVQSQKPRQAALDLIRSNYVLNPSIFVEALRNWILLHVTIIDEFEELAISPQMMIDQIESTGMSAGDCDDIAMLSAAMLVSVGAEAQLCACFPQSDGTYGHVFCRYRFPGMIWSDFDPTIGYNKPHYPDDTLTVDIIS